ncbi:C80 family cysteine peptidase, partial [Candidatus Williamhamiltonella defendens]|uniref:C80 family cysteine peptidase n=1 Tax=Candidatus Williamhamiltonella defendens TaxID=138072 RepID=UPI001582D1B5
MGNSVSARHTREANQQMTSSNSESSEIGNDLNQYQITNTENRDLIEKKILKLARVDGKSFNPEYLDFDSNSAMEDLFKKRTRLQKDAKLYFKEKSIQGRSEFHLSLFANQGKTAESISIKEFLRNNSGLVIGESHSALTSKKLLIDNMKILASKGVKVLYLEHLFSDLHQEYLDKYFSSGKMPKQLHEYLNILDRGHHTDRSGQYTFLKLVEAAKNAKIKIIAIDCAASYINEGINSRDKSKTRIQMMNYFAEKIISQDVKNNNKKWIAFVGNTHTNTMHDTPGLAELTNVIGIRVEDSNENNLSIDPGKNIEGIENIQRPGKIFIKADLLLKINVNSHDQINIERLPIAPSIKHSHPVSDKSFSQAETRFAGQIIVELEEDRVVSDAAKRLAGKHAERSLIIQLKKEGGYEVVKGNPYLLRGDLRWQVVGHSREGANEGYPGTFGGLSAQQLSNQLIALHAQLKKQFRINPRPKYISLVGCSLAAAGVEDKSYAQHFGKALKHQAGWQTDIGARRLPVTVNAEGRKLSV